MKKLFAIIAMVAVCSFGATTSVLAQEDTAATEQVDSAAVDSVAADTVAAEETVEAAPIVEEENEGIFKTLKTKYIEGDAGFMSLVAIALVLGLAFCIERVVYLTLAQINTRKFMKELADLVAAGKVADAIEKCKGTRGPVSQVSRKAMECLDSADRNDIATIERTINMEAEVQGSYLEENCSWITLFIAMAPSLGFLGTVIGMVMAFDDIQRAGDISPTVVAGGMKVALITTIFGIIVALILQLFYNYILSKVETLTSNMEEAAQELLVMCVKSDKCKK
ncbi:MAG: MotA/TolQ/ExbB proton channel family protein [Bacteroidaceae bacterium]|jgi:biopolymer transport protein ExbB|nr:MotA/TolQ/ExbB proton channel family protein [Bacteroidaceae bacterium]MBQ2292332.1 MotA/TolQ/ExbB proton channel family protein [Bacteroidaceae bacterium]MBQ2301417.1 MotA/TolQ/ExbB proton channel family protein [Bacteroidaceae bacterium]MBQ5680307.1 MotA/TolQ/ExbB proton channel family protein [Bacteroidaceae bacterium]MBQ5714562.1 MotA/TolQ/ExbB proton channel family protein [Bacteroidaceae bacterium]